MNKKILLTIFITTLFVLISVVSVSAVEPRYDFANPRISGRDYGQSPVFKGGWFGANTMYSSNVRPAFYAGPAPTTWNRNAWSSNYYPVVRAGGWFGSSKTYYKNFRGTVGMYNYGSGTTYGNVRYVTRGYRGLV